MLRLHPPILSPNALRGWGNWDEPPKQFLAPVWGEEPPPGVDPGHRPRGGTSPNSPILPGGVLGHRQHFGGVHGGYQGSDGALPGLGELPPRSALRISVVLGGFLPARGVRAADGAGCFQRLSQLLLPWHRGYNSPAASRRICALPRGARPSRGGLFGVGSLPAHPRGFSGMGRERRVGYEDFIRPSRQNPFQMWGCRCWHSFPRWVTQHEGDRAAPRDLHPRPLRPLSWNGDFYIFPLLIFPRFGANPQHRPSCDSGIGGNAIPASLG